MPDPRSVHMRRTTVGEQFFENQRAHVLALGPQHHQYDHLDLVERHHLVIERHGALKDDFAAKRIENAGGFEELHEAARVTIELIGFDAGETTEGTTGSEFWGKRGIGSGFEAA